MDKAFWIFLGAGVLGIAVMILIGCNQEQNPITTIIDGCEYVRVRGYNSFAHKGNCRQCEERLRKIIKEEVKVNEIR
jgi:uncharacterized lipoprotein NlpE involved in copper resistance